MPAHPSNYLSAATAEILRSYATEAERLGQLHPAQLEIIYEKKWFLLLASTSCGGAGANLPEALRLLEALAWADGSCGWTVTLCSGAGWFTGFMEPAIGKNLLADPKACLAGSGQSTAIARVTKQGWEVSGHWNFASGAPHASHFTFNARVERDGKILQNDRGEDLLLTAWVPRSQVLVLHSWQAMGMVATASHSFELEKLPVSAEQCFTLDPAYAVDRGPLYQFPFQQLAETTIAVNLAGMAQRFLELAAPVKEGIEKKTNALQQLQDWRLALYALAEKSWHQLEQGHPIPADILQAISYSARRLGNGAHSLVNEVFPFCGLLAANRNTEINRVWRNLNTAALHSVLH